MEWYKKQSITVKWCIIFALASLILTGLITSFRFETIEIQLHDTYYVIQPVEFALLIFLTSWLLRGLFLLIDLLTDQNKPIAILIIILNGLLLLTTMVITFNWISTVVTLRPLPSYLPNDTGTIMMTIILTGLNYVLLVIEINTIKKI